jgi:hypothetical protein
MGTVGLQTIPITYNKIWACFCTIKGGRTEMTKLCSHIWLQLFIYFGWALSYSYQCSGIQFAVQLLPMIQLMHPSELIN